MNEFIAKYGNRISGTLAGVDRLVFRGNLALNHESGMKGDLWTKQVPWKDYAAHVHQISTQVKQAALAPLEASQRPIRYLPRQGQQGATGPRHCSPRWHHAGFHLCVYGGGTLYAPGGSAAIAAPKSCNCSAA